MDAGQLATIKRWAEALGYNVAQTDGAIAAARKDPENTMRQLEARLAKAKRRGFSMTK